MVTTQYAFEIPCNGLKRRWIVIVGGNVYNPPLSRFRWLESKDDYALTLLMERSLFVFRIDYLHGTILL